MNIWNNPKLSLTEKERKNLKKLGRTSRGCNHRVVDMAGSNSVKIGQTIRIKWCVLNKRGFTAFRQIVVSKSNPYIDKENQEKIYPYRAIYLSDTRKL